MEKPEGDYRSNESVQAGVRKLAAILFGIGLAIAYWLWPDGITNLPLAQITFGTLLWAAASCATMLAALVMAILLWID